MNLSLFAGAALLAASTALYAQAPKADADKGKREEYRAKMKGAHAKAAKACEGKQHAERRECMTREMCAQSKDPKACEARVAAAKDARAKAAKACEGQQGDAHRACMRTQMCAQAKDPKACEARAKERAERRSQKK